MDISPYTDCAVMMAALGSGLYCLMLRREIKALSANKKGLKASIGQMTEATKAAGAALADLKEQVRLEIEELDAKLVQVAEARREVEDMLDSADGQVAYQTRRMQEARIVTEQAIAPLLQQAEERVHSLSRLASSMAEPVQPRPARRTAAQARPLHEGASRDRHDRLEENPFLKAVHG
jgi:ABC-type transporter Mla subunit MlaD